MSKALVGFFALVLSSSALASDIFGGIWDAVANNQPFQLSLRQNGSELQGEALDALGGPINPPIFVSGTIHHGEMRLSFSIPQSNLFNYQSYVGRTFLSGNDLKISGTFTQNATGLSYDWRATKQ